MALLKPVIIALATMAFSFSAFAQDKLVLLKTAKLDLASGLERLDLSDTKGAYRALRIKLVEGRLTLSGVTIQYLDRTEHLEDRRIVLLAGERTREIDPAAKARFIETVTLSYVAAPGQTAVVEIYGRQSPRDALRDREQERPSPVVAGQYKKTAKTKKIAAEAQRLAAEAQRRAQDDAERQRSAAEAQRRAQNDAERQRSAAEAQQRAQDDAERQRSAAKAARGWATERQESGSARYEAPAASAPQDTPRSVGSAPVIAPEMRPMARRSISAPTPLACVVENTCTPVQVFFGTNRGREDLTTRIAFGWKDSGALALGGAVVTVPRRVTRETGSIQLPTWWDRYVLRVPAEGDPARHFVIVPDRFEIYSDEAQFLAAVSRHMTTAGDYKDHAFVYVHGYRVGFDDALYRTAQIAYDLGSPRAEDGVIVPFGTPFLYSWPSAAQLKDYAYDQESARLSVQHLRQFLELVVARTGVKHVHLVAHSMGNVPLLNALGQFIGGETAGAKINQVILAAPDMGTREFKSLADQIQPLATGFTLYASSSDLALEASRRVHKNEPRAGDVVGGKPVIAAGVDTIDISAITTCYFCFGHDEYVEQSELLNDIAQLMRAGLRPPHSRTQSFKYQTDPDGAFWRFQN